MWALAGIAAFLLLAYVGRQSRLGKLKPAPWIRQFRAVRSVVSMALFVLAVTLFVRGLWWEGIIAGVVALAMGGTVRWQVYGRAQGPETVASYSAEEVAAYRTLDLPVGADRKAVKVAWKAKMKSAHPDQGGTTARASALNAARDVLLRRK